MGPMPTVEDVEDALTNVIDPELGLDFVELGLVYEIEVEGGDVYVTFTLTSPGCPIGPQVSEQMKEFVSELPDVSGYCPKMVFTPAWTPDLDERRSEVRARLLALSAPKRARKLQGLPSAADPPFVGALGWKIGTPEEGERPLALKMAGALWLTAAASIALCLLIPGAVTRHWQFELVLAGLMAIWGVACLLIPPKRSVPLTFHAPALLAVAGDRAEHRCDRRRPLVSDLRLLLADRLRRLLLQLPGGDRICGLSGLAVALPLAYDRGAVDDGLLAELFVVAPALLVLSVVMAGAKSRLVGLRNAAHELSLVDPLTELPNRRAFSERVGTQIGGERASDATGLMLVDLDEFKEINTLHGHPGGDRVLCETAQGLRSAAREGDMVSRIGGDEFAIVLHAVDAEGMRPAGRARARRRPSDQLEVVGRASRHPPDGQRGLGALPRHGEHARRADHGGGHEPARRQGQRQGQRGVAGRLRARPA